MAVEARVLHACRTAEEERARDERARRDEADRFKAAAHVHTENELQASRQLIKDKEVELAALIAKNKTIINRIYHLDRGYEFLERKLKNCKAEITRV